MSDDDFDVDNMDFDLPDAVGGVSSNSNSNSNNISSGDARASRDTGSAVATHPQSKSGLTQGRRTLDPATKEAAKRWVCLYPVYIDAAKSWDEGRRVSKSQAAHEPAALFMAEAVNKLGLTAVFEQESRHPRDAFTFGRIRVQLKDAHGRACNPLYPTKRALMIKVAAMLPEIGAAVIDAEPRMAGFAAASRSLPAKRVLEIEAAAVQAKNGPAAIESSASGASASTPAASQSATATATATAAGSKSTSKKSKKK
eukprot:jgi/Hompol1/5515/HPOL_002270-RA